VTPRLVRAAGGVVGRGAEVVLVHRPRYDDWSLPKGKLDKGEHPLLAGVREVGEETGVLAVPRLRLPSTRYLTGNPDVEKIVDYWVMDYRDSAPFTPNDEVDDVRWVPVAQAAGLLTYAHDRGVLSAYPRVARTTGLVVLLRHAYAGVREHWSGHDLERPLDETGFATVRRLTPVLAAYEPTRVLSARPLRCTQTVEPLAERTGLPVDIDDSFDESALPKEAAAIIRGLGAAGGVTVVCSQGGLIPDVVATLSGRDRGAYRTPKGSAWVLGFGGTEFVGADRLDPDQDETVPE
jgi:8-oxo-dGTP pyrophosphatase MutT (NUDIX family)/phosphohistidine phosphatase SixA